MRSVVTDPVGGARGYDHAGTRAMLRGFRARCMKAATARQGRVGGLHRPERRGGSGSRCSRDASGLDDGRQGGDRRLVRLRDRLKTSRLYVMVSREKKPRIVTRASGESTNASRRFVFVRGHAASKGNIGEGRGGNARRIHKRIVARKGTRARKKRLGSVDCTRKNACALVSAVLCSVCPWVLRGNGAPSDRLERFSRARMRRMRKASTIKHTSNERTEHDTQAGGVGDLHGARGR